MRLSAMEAQFPDVYNVEGGITAYAGVDPSVVKY
jgi:hypothetical protein